MLPSQSELRPDFDVPSYPKPDRMPHMVFFSSGTTGLPKAFQIPFDVIAVSIAQAR